MRLTHSALLLAYAAWSSATSFELSTCSTLRKLLLRPRLCVCIERGSLMLGGLRPLMVMGGRERRKRLPGPSRAWTVNQVSRSAQWQCALVPCYVASLVHSPTRWPCKSRCITILVSSARALVTYIPQGCTPVRRAARDSLVSFNPPPLTPRCLSRVSSPSEVWALRASVRSATVAIRRIRCDGIRIRVCASRSRCCILSCRVH